MHNCRIESTQCFLPLSYAPKADESVPPPYAGQVYRKPWKWTMQQLFQVGARV